MSRATWLLFSGIPTWCAVLLVRCPGPLGSCLPVCPRGVLCCVCGVLGHLAPVHRCARSVRVVARAVSWATWLLFRGVPARCVVLRVRCSGLLGSCSPVCWLGVLCCVCGVLGHLAPVHRCACSVRCAVCRGSLATRLLFIALLARCVVLRVRCTWPLGSCSPVCPLCALCCLCGVVGHLATPVHRCGHSVRSVACAVSLATRLLFTAVLARCVVLRVPCPWQLSSCSPLCLPPAFRCACGLPVHLAPVHKWTPTVRCAVCAVSFATWLLFTSVLARCILLLVRCHCPLGSSSAVCWLRVLYCLCGVLGHLPPVHLFARSVFSCVRFAHVCGRGCVLTHAGVAAGCALVHSGGGCFK